jgi:[acyl-carrier-protein] S-malonyltransferase
MTAAGPSRERANPALAFVFPGQGSQKVGMGRAHADPVAAARATFAEADDALGFALSRLCFEGPEETLRLTEHTQPAILAASVAAYRVLVAETGLRPGALAGHSLGEWSALVAAGALPFADAVRLVRTRGRLMQEAVPVGTGAMSALLGLDAPEVEAACREAAQGEVVEPANFNAPGQVVIAGHAAAVARAGEAAKARGAKRALPLPVSAPFHCSLMKPAGEGLARALAAATVGRLGVPVYSNVEAAPYPGESSVVDLLVRQVSSPVRWDALVRAMSAAVVRTIIEVGPGDVLAGLVKRIDRGLETRHFDSPDELPAVTGR